MVNVNIKEELPLPSSYTILGAASVIQRQNSSTSTNLSSSFKNDAFFVLEQPSDGFFMTDEQGKDEEEYIEKVQETSCPVSLTDDKHKDTLMRRLSTLQRNKEFCDVVLYADEKEIFCHKVVLAALSPRFYELFVGGQTTPSAKNGLKWPQTGSINVRMTSSNMNGGAKGSGAESDPTAATPSTLSEACQTNTSSLTTERLTYYELRDVDYESLNAIVDFAYRGRLEITNDRVAQLYKAAYSLRVQTCVKACANYLLKMLNVKNCIGLRKCANRTHDSLLGNEIDLFIIKKISEIVCESCEFTSLPCIQVDVFLSIDDRVKFKRDMKVGEKVIDWLQRETSTLPEHVEFRMELLTARPYMLYLDAECLLQDCNDLDDNSTMASCDMVVDYKRQTRLYSKKNKLTIGNSGNNGALVVSGAADTHHAMAGTNGHHIAVNGNGASNPNSYNGRLYSAASNESVCSLVSDLDECEWKLIAISRNSENYYVALAIVKRKLAALSIRINDTPFYQPGDTDRLALFLAKKNQQDSTLDATGELLATMNDQRCSIGAVFYDGQLIVCGGNNRGECLKSVESFNMITNKWSNLAPMLKERGRFGACVCDGKLYVVGGSDGTCDLNTCERFDPSTNEWTKLADFSTAPKSSNMVASVGGKVYSLGGFDGQAARRTCERYDPSIDKWEVVASMAVGRYQAGCCTWLDKIIVVGGYGTWSCVSSAEIYDYSTNTWRPLPNMIAAGRGCGAAVLNNKLYVAGGSDGSQTLCSVQVLDLATPGASWRPGPPLNAPRGNVHLVAAECRVYAVGGFSGKLFSNTIEYLDEGATEWRTTTPSLPVPVTSLVSTRSLAALLSSTTIVEEPDNEAAVV